MRTPSRTLGDSLLQIGERMDYPAKIDMRESEAAYAWGVDHPPRPVGQGEGDSRGGGVAAAPGDRGYLGRLPAPLPPERVDPRWPCHPSAAAPHASVRARPR